MIPAKDVLTLTDDEWERGYSGSGLYAVAIDDDGRPAGLVRCPDGDNGPDLAVLAAAFDELAVAHPGASLYLATGSYGELTAWAPFEPVPMSATDVALMRARLGLSKPELAALCGVKSETTVNRWESGKMPPLPEHAAAMNRLLAAQDRAVEALLAAADRVVEADADATIVLPAPAATIEEARQAGMPTRSAHLAVIRRIVEALVLQGVPHRVWLGNPRAGAAADHENVT